ncbi:hypothetical protein [Candidatus Neptunochlamydia vexilliferae]|uniref:Uncharacterized protein n=1 Tax=Candidatus Neptunichlamydia vexilliferae TaxID=1651774 RepID=A0ABS0B3L4_9BACT|nr:hypothetical protein [Candidatus Neptunochlamydia vexilliferae]MBF5060190.1 hypothetical protein [Candidatus Neptunochlamydia vexilliferae]
MAQTARISSKSDMIIKEIVTLTGMSKVEIMAWFKIQHAEVTLPEIWRPFHLM